MPKQHAPPTGRNLTISQLLGLSLGVSGVSDTDPGGTLIFVHIIVAFSVCSALRQLSRGILDGLNGRPCGFL